MIDENQWWLSCDDEFTRKAIESGYVGVTWGVGPMMTTRRYPFVIKADPKAGRPRDRVLYYLMTEEV